MKKIIMTEQNLEQRLTAVETDNEALREIVLGALQIAAQNASAIATLTAEMREMRQLFATEIREMRSEIRGIQVENQRIIRHFFGDEEDTNN
jgi:hypothetical protein